MLYAFVFALCGEALAFWVRGGAGGLASFEDGAGPAHALVLIAVGIIGVVVDLMAATLLRGAAHGHSHAGATSARAAAIHAVADAANSVLVAAVGAVLLVTGSASTAASVDAACPFALAVLVYVTSKDVIVENVAILMEQVRAAATVTTTLLRCCYRYYCASRHGLLLTPS